jgi:hypothetical protein
MKHAAQKQNGFGNATKHGLTTLKRAVNSIGNRVIDRRTVTGRALAQWRKDLIRDIGGDPSTQELALVDLAVKTKLLLDSADAWLLSQPSLIDKRKRCFLPAAKERQAFADSLARYLSQLGMKRVKKEVTLQDYVREHYGNRGANAAVNTVPQAPTDEDQAQ